MNEEQWKFEVLDRLSRIAGALERIANAVHDSDHGGSYLNTEDKG